MYYVKFNSNVKNHFKLDNNVSLFVLDCVGSVFRYCGTVVHNFPLLVKVSTL